MLDDAHAGGPGADEVAARVQAHVTEPLHDERLAAPAGGRAWGEKWTLGITGTISSYT